MRQVYTFKAHGTAGNVAKVTLGGEFEAEPGTEPDTLTLRAVETIRKSFPDFNGTRIVIKLKREKSRRHR